MKNKLIEQKLLLAIAAGFILGMLWLVAIRFITYKSDAVHHHANFELYIDGERQNFESFAFYEEVQSCGGDELNNPKGRAHMHDQVNDVVHVHDNAATWGHFFANLGYTLGDDILATDAKVYQPSKNNKLSFILNGESVNNIANQTIRSEDKLLINYGDDSEETLNERFDGIDTSAGVYNTQHDPAACSGGKALTFTERLKEAIGVF